MGSYLCSGPDLAGSSLRVQSSHIWDILSSTNKIENTEKYSYIYKQLIFNKGAKAMFGLWRFGGNS